MDEIYPWAAFAIGLSVLLMWLCLRPRTPIRDLRKPYYDEWEAEAKRETEEWHDRAAKTLPDEFNIFDLIEQGKKRDQRDEQHELRT